MDKEVFLTARKQQVILNDASSDTQMVTVRTGVPQGSALGPALFLFYINDDIIVENQLLCKTFC